MKRVFVILFQSLGWILLVLFLLSGYFFNKLSLNADQIGFQPIVWENHMQLFDGAIQCSLMGEELMERKKTLKEQVFSKVIKKEEIHNGYRYYFDNDDLLLDNVLDFIKYEKKCCPFFKFDIGILPFESGFAVQISGSNEVFEMLKDFEENEF